MTPDVQFALDVLQRIGDAFAEAQEGDPGELLDASVRRLLDEVKRQRVAIAALHGLLEATERSLAAMKGLAEERRARIDRLQDMMREVSR